MAEVYRFNQSKVDQIVPAWHINKPLPDDPSFEAGLTSYLTSVYNPSQLAEMYQRFSNGQGDFDSLMRRVFWKALCKNIGQDLAIGLNVSFKHPETFEIGDGVFVGDQVIIQGRINGQCKIGNRCWIGPQVFLDARSLTIEDEVGIGPGAKILGSNHTGLPDNISVIRTDLEIKPIRICKGAEIGINAVLLPGVTIGEGAIVGASATVTKDVLPLTIVTGTPARFLRKRND